MAAGKSTVARAVADRLKWRAEDVDELIEARERRPIADIFAKSGEPYFRATERDILKLLLPLRHIVVATGGGTFMDPENRAAINLDGVSVWLDVPFEELLARIEALLRRGREQRQRASTLQVADLVLDLERMQASRAGQPIALTARELAFLELLMSAPGRVYSRERILSNVWGTNEDPLTNVVDVYVRRLRGKIDEGRALALIKTVRGFGYRLDATAD